MQPLATTRVCWRLPAEGGRSSGPPPGPIYAATARLTADGEEFSVVLRLLKRADLDGRTSHEAELSLLHADHLPDIAQQLVPGSRLTIREGRRVVADCEVRSVRLVEIGIHF